MGKAARTRSAKQPMGAPAYGTGARGYATLPTDAPALGHNDYMAAALAALFALLVYLRTLAPTITGGDSGEFLSAAYTLGVPHPPGYPLWCMLGKLFTIIVPFNSIAWRVGFVSSFFGVATCFVVCLVIIKVTANRFAGVAAAAALAVSSEFWKWNVVAETYSLNAFLIVLCMLLLLSWYETRQKKLLYCFGFVYGLGLCNHHTMHFMGPVFALFILSVDRSPWRRLITYFIVVGITVGVWGIIHLYIPIRAAANPYCNFDDPSNWERFWSVVTRKPYREGVVGEPRTLLRFGMQCWVFFQQYATQFTLWMVWLPLLGVYPLWKRNRYAAGLVCGSFVYVALGLIWIINSDFDKTSVWLNSKFWIPAYVMAAILIGVAIAWIASIKLQMVPFKPLALLLAAAVVILPLHTHYKANDKSSYYFAYDYIMNLAKTFEPNAYLFGSSEYALFGMFYLQSVENVRTDVSLVNKYGYIEGAVREILPLDKRGASNDPWDAPTNPEKAAMGAWLTLNTDRPVYYNVKTSLADVQGVKMIDAGMLCRMTALNRQPPEHDYWGEYRWHTLEKADAYGDSTAENLLAEYYWAHGRDFLGRGDTERGTEELKAAIDAAGRHTVLLSNIGATCTDEYKLFDLAKECFNKALDINPKHRQSLRNLAVVAFMAEDFDGMRDAFKRLLEVDEAKYGPDDPLVAGTVNNLGGAYLFLGDLDNAEKCFKRALRIDQSKCGAGHPNTARDMNNLGIVLEQRGDIEAGEKYRLQAIESLMQSYGPGHPFTELARQGMFIQSMGN